MSLTSGSSWYQKLMGLLFAIFCFELGAFLLVFPWTQWWGQNYFSWIPPNSPDQLAWSQWWRGVWLSPSFRGACSGLGLVNLYIALRAVFGLRRFSPPSQDPSPVPIE